MEHLLHWLPDDTLKGILLAIGYPVAVLALLEAARALGSRRNSIAADILRHAGYLLLPTGAIWLILRELAGLPANDTLVRSAETAFGLTALYLLLSIGQGVLMSVMDNRTNAPKLLLDVLRIGLSLVWGAVMVSSIWDVDLGSLFAAMGVGSIVLGFALQEFLGNLLSGLGLLSSHKFGIGDWIVIDGVPARVLEMDWRTVTLTKEGKDRIVVANSTLAKSNLVIAARGGEPTTVVVPLTFGVDTPPEHIRSAVREAAQALPVPTGAAAAQCLVTGIAGGMINYDVILPIVDAGDVEIPRNEFLSRFWYVAQRRGLRMDGTANATSPTDADDRLRLLQANGAFHGDNDVLAQIAADGEFHRYRHGDLLLEAGAPVLQAFLVLTGSLAVSVPTADGEARVERVRPAQLLVLNETLSGGPSPVRVRVDHDADLMAIPAATLIAIIERDPAFARDVRALAEARRLAIHPPKAGLRAVG